MRPYGFSTGAIAKGDFEGALACLRRHSVRAVELSALRSAELPRLVEALPRLDLSAFRYVAIHAPSGYDEMDESRVVELLSRTPKTFPIVIHPDAIEEVERWRTFGDRLLVENMDQRKRAGRTVAELQRWMRDLPEARFCFDLGHAHQIDTTMSIATMMLLRFRDRIAQIHLSEVTPSGSHISMTFGARQAFSRLAPLLPADLPVILESVVSPDQVPRELELARRVLGDEASPGHATIAATARELGVSY